jgi:beta-glucosidase/6-phospho-beta-glucosidase/beta-galactosidase
LEKSCLFRSFFLGGFECSSHKLKNGRRLDLIASTQHDTYAEQDYRRLQEIGIRSCRDGIRWHLIEQSPGKFDFSSVLPMVRAARKTGMQVIWDVCHYGWPDHINILEPEFVHRLAALSRAFTSLLAQEQNEPPYLSLVNEISFFAWGGGTQAVINPYLTGSGDQLKRQLVRATIEGIEAVRDVSPGARFVQVDPLIHIITDPSIHNGADVAAAEAHMSAQFDAWDMIAGKLHPELGGHESYLDIIGFNYYVHNQWFYNSQFVERDHPQYRPLQKLIEAAFLRYRRPVFIAETGIEDDLRPSWLSYICDEAVACIRAGIPVEGVCLYPVINHPGWEDDRHCYNGLWDYADERGNRELYEPLAVELRRQTLRIEKIRAETGECVAT